MRIAFYSTVILFSLISLAALVYLVVSSFYTPLSDQRKNSVTPLQAQTDQQIKHDEWKEYTNQQLSLKYPPDALVKENPDGSIQLILQTTKITFTLTSKEDVSLDEILKLDIQN